MIIGTNIAFWHVEQPYFIELFKSLGVDDEDIHYNTN